MTIPHHTNAINAGKIIPVAKAYLPNKEKYMGYVDSIFESGWLTNSGILLKELENKLAQHLGVKNVVCVANGTLALQLAYKALDLKGEAITTPFSFPATTSSLVWQGLKPIFADIDPNSFNIAPENIEKLINANTNAIVPVHVFGNPCQVEEIQKIAEHYSIKVIYDAAHALGVNYTDESGSKKNVLSYGDISTLSFHSTKLFHTIEGGAVITNDDDLAKKIRLLMNFGISGISTIESVGINAKMNEFEAAMGLCILDELDVIRRERSRIYKLYKDELNNMVGFQQWNKNSNNNHAYAPILLRTEKSLLNVERKLKEKNIHPRRYFYPSLDTLNYLDKSTGVEMKNSRDISSRILCLPMFTNLKRDEQMTVIDVVKKHCI